MPKARLLIPLKDYERMFRVIFSVLEGRAHTPHACVFFSVVGSLILREIYKTDARPVAGAAAVLVDDDKRSVVTFGRIDDRGVLRSDTDSFHCWVDADGVIVDLLAPLFEESARNYGHEIAVPKRMFQKSTQDMVGSLDELDKAGDFLLSPNPQLSHVLLTRFAKRPSATDLANVCLAWYKRPPKPLPSDMAMQDDLGNVFRLQLKGPRITEAW